MPYPPLDLRTDSIRRVSVSRRRHRLLWAGVAAIILTVAVSGTWWFFSHRHAGADAGAVIHAVSRHYLLPTNETPALATVTDKSKLTTPLFANAKNGDRVLIYQTNKLAIIYRPSIDRIVAVGPVSIDPPPSAATKP